MTCVDWQLMHPDLGNVIGCCSDDKRIRAFRFDPEQMTFEKILEFDFSFIPEFFTLTYMALDKVGQDDIGRSFLQRSFSNRPFVSLRHIRKEIGIQRKGPLGRHRGSYNVWQNYLHSWLR